MSVRELRRLASERGIELDELADALRALPKQRQGALSQAETELLRGFGIDPAEGARSPLLTGILLRGRLERESLTTRQVGELLDRDPSRVRQRLDGSTRSLLGFHRRSGQGEWLLPRFQFELALHDLEVWARLLQALPPADETSPTALVAWLRGPRPHLAGRSRAQALAEGHDIDELVAEAATFGTPV